MAAMDNSQDRGRRLSQQGRHTSPQPSPGRLYGATPGLDPSINQSTFTTGRFNTAQPPELSSQNTAAQPYLSNYSLNQNTMMNHPYLDQSLNATPFNQNYTLQSNSYGDDINPGFAIGPFQNLNQQDNVNPADLSKMSSPEQRSPRLLSPEHRSSPGPQSPTMANGQYQTTQHGRQTSLAPNSAYGGDNWQGINFRQHQRAPSDVSDVSSVHGHSPYLQQVELNDPSHSPLFPAQDNSSTFGMDNFSLGEQAHSQPGSTYVSPRLMPQQEGLGLTNDMTLLNQGFMPNEMFPQDQAYSAVASMHARNQSVVSQMGQADQTEPPSIHIEPAPVSRQQSFGPQGELMNNALSPPSGHNRGRNRSQSDVTFTRPINSSRSLSPGPGSRHGSLGVNRSSSPGGSASRSPSPGVSDGRITKERRSSTASINNNNREYILDLADPNRPNNTTGGNGTRVQKHPATFQCTLCPKRFTRAYNLRSHLRTHTDERPFVCTVCGKAFARQHDRKRHEGLHSGEKKFVCKGELQHSPGQSWGCGRRFARADALGRHFRSEAGRVCIKPLLDEEAAERTQKMMMEQQLHANAQHQAQMQAQGMLQPVPQPMMISGGMDPNGGFTLPAALLAQYPALQNIDWSAIHGSTDDPGELSDVGYGGGYDDGSFGDGHLSDSGLHMPHAQWE